MAMVYLFNTSSIALMFSINNAPYSKISSTSESINWIPFSPQYNPKFVNHTYPPQGGLGLGNNTLSMFPFGAGSDNAVSVQVVIPEDVTVSSVQLYFFWKDALHAGAAVCNGGQFIQAISLSDIH